MRKHDDVTHYLPLSEATTYIMLMLATPRHGYAVMQEVEALTGGAITIGPGTLYGAFSTLEQEGMIEMVREEKRRKVYVLTAKGKAVVRAQVERLAMMARHGQEILDGGESDG